MDQKGAVHMGFTYEEWVAALSRPLSDAAARSYVDLLFRTPEASGPPVQTGQRVFLSPETYALLSLVSEDCQRRVVAILAEAPTEFIQQFRGAVEVHAAKPKPTLWERIFRVRRAEIVVTGQAE